MQDRISSVVDGVQVLGLCRFSVPSLGAFQVEHDEIGERRAFLYDPRRLDLRFIWFEQVFLPAIAQQKDPHFRIVVLLGEDFPEPWRARMEAHIAAVPQLVAQYAPPDHHRDICRAAMTAHIDPVANVVLQFRHDDDDAVAVDFTKRLRRDFRRGKATFQTHGRLAIDYCRGINLSDRGGNLRAYPQLEAFLGIAFAIAFSPDADRAILDYQHNHVWKHMPTVTSQDDFMWVRGAHGGNDSGSPRLKDDFRIEQAELNRALRRRFRIEQPALKAALRAYHAQYGQDG